VQQGSLLGPFQNEICKFITCQQSLKTSSQACGSTVIKPQPKLNEDPPRFFKTSSPSYQPLPVDVAEA